MVAVGELPGDGIGKARMAGTTSLRDYAAPHCILTTLHICQISKQLHTPQYIQFDQLFTPPSFVVYPSPFDITDYFADCSAFLDHSRKIA